MMSSRRARPRRTRALPQETLVVLLLVIVILGSFAAYYSLTQRSGANGLDAAEIYANSRRSVVAVQGVKLSSGTPVLGSGSGWVSVYGSGFVVKYSGSNYVVTNFHVVDSLVNLTVTFWNGDAYRGKVVGLDAYSDVGLVSIPAPSQEFYPLEFGSSSSLRVGEPVVAIGNPYGLSGTITFGIISQTGRAINYGSSSSGYPIADIIQTSAPINPGNSGGPLMNADGKVVGITSAGVNGAGGLGFAIPSDTILRELHSLATTGRYDEHPYLGIQVADMSYELALATGANVTFGVLIEKTVPGGPADKFGLRNGTQQVEVNGQSYITGGDIIVSINGIRIVNYDSLSTYLERNALPGQRIQVGVIRSGTYMVIDVVLGARPPFA